MSDFRSSSRVYFGEKVTGKSKVQATTALLQVPGVQSVSISIDNKSTTFPAEATHIHLILLPVG
jgi:hypothetical protein